MKPWLSVSVNGSMRSSMGVASPTCATAQGRDVPGEKVGSGRRGSAGG